MPLWDNQLFVQSLQMMADAINGQTHLEMQRTQMLGQAQEQKRNMDLREQNLQLEQQGLVLKQQIEARRAKEAQDKENQKVDFDQLVGAKDFAAAEKLYKDRQSHLEQQATLNLAPDQLQGLAGAGAPPVNPDHIPRGASLDDIRKELGQTEDTMTRIYSDIRTAATEKIRAQLSQQSAATMQSLQARAQTLRTVQRAVGNVVAQDPTLKQMYNKLNVAQGRAAGLATLPSAAPPAIDNAGGALGQRATQQTMDNLNSGSMVTAIEPQAANAYKLAPGSAERSAAAKQLVSTIKAEYSNLPQGDPNARRLYFNQVKGTLLKYGSEDDANQILSQLK